MTDIKYDSKKHWAINYDIYCGYANLTDAQIEYYTKEIRTLLTDGGNFAHVEIDGDGTLITIWADNNLEDLINFNQLLTAISSVSTAQDTIFMKNTGFHCTRRVDFTGITKHNHTLRRFLRKVK